MSEPNSVQTDSGIQDTLSSATKREDEKQNGAQSPVKANEHNGTEDIANPSNQKSNGDISKSTTDMRLDLSDPDTVIHMLETVNLNEEDTEGLLQEAYNMNRKLKEILRRQEKDDAEKASYAAKSKPKSKLKARKHDSSASSTNSSESGSRVVSSFGSRKILPPIMGEKETSVYAIKLKRSKTNIVDTRGMNSGVAVPRSKSSKDSVSPTRQKKSGPRPEWNDRFNYT